jgi:hypothetical protein
MIPIQGPNFIFLAVTSQNEAKKPWLREPWIIIPAKVIESFQNLNYIGELRQRWEEIKKLQLNPEIAI